MRTSLTSRGATWRRVVAAVAVAALPLGIVAATGGVASAHEAPGSPVEVFTDTTASASVADAIQHGWWGHEGGANDGTGTGTSFLDLDGSDADLSQFTDLSNLRVAFVATSSDGSAEHPVATPGQSVDQVFSSGWFMDAGLQTGLNGTANPNDSVNTVSSPSEYNAWYAAGKPVQGYDNSLVSHDVTAPGNPVSTAPKGKSILNRWPAGTNISMVFYESTGAISGANELPIVKVVGGHAVTAYMPFTTVAKSTDSTRSSAGYTNTAFGAVVAPAVATTTTLTANPASPTVEGTSIDLTAAVSPNTGSTTPVGHVEFFDNSNSLGVVTVNGSGSATLPAQTFPHGTHPLSAVFTPDNAADFETSTGNLSYVSNVTPATPTTTSVAAPDGSVTTPVDMTATINPTAAAGTVQFKEGPTNLGAPVTVSGGLASATWTFTTSGSHTITAAFTPDNPAQYTASQGTVTITLTPDTSGRVDEQTITATIPDGSLTVSTPYTPTSPLNITGTGPLGALALNTATDVPGATALTGFFGTANFQHINVLDTRSGAKPWTLVAQAGSMTSGSNSINGENLGLTDLTPEANNNPGLGTIQTFQNPVPVAPVSPTHVGTSGLGGIPHTVLSENFGTADAWYSGTLTLFAPTTTPSGLYTGTITFTAS